MVTRVIEPSHNLVITRKIGGIGGGLVEPFPGNRSEQQDRVLLDGLEEQRVEVAIEILGLRLPAPPQILGKWDQSADPLWEHSGL
jgi:hypothetical protein